MTVLEQINSLKSSGIYNKLLRSGVISLKVDFHYEMYKAYQQRLTEKGVSRRDAIFIVSEDFKVCEGTVYNAVKFIGR